MNRANDTARSSLARTVLDYNPFYLLSAMCMLAGLFALNNSLDWSPLPLVNLLWLILILNLYEGLLIGLGVFLYRRGLTRDATTLLMLEAFFLVDAGFLNSESFTSSFNIGVAVNVTLMILAAVKVLAVFKGMKLPLSDGRAALILIQLFVLLATPGVMKHVSQERAGQLPALTLYGIWWVVGLLPLLYVLLVKPGPASRQQAIIGAFVVLPMISILAHMCTSNWVYNVRWYHANLSPLLLGLAVALGASDYHVKNLTARLRAQLLLPIAAILLAAPERSRLVFDLHDIAFSPLRLTLLAGAAVYVHGLLVHRHLYFGLAGAMCLTAAGMGSNIVTILETADSVRRSTLGLLWRLMPKTVVHWGIVSLVWSFVLLAVGLAVSLLKTPRIENEPAQADQDEPA